MFKFLLLCSILVFPYLFEFWARAKTFKIRLNKVFHLNQDIYNKGI